MFIYNILVKDTIADNSTITKNINIGSEDFELHEIRTSEISKLRVKIQTADGNLWSSTAFDSGIIGKGINGYKLPVPSIVPAKTQLIIEIFNNSGVTVSNFELNLIGRKITAAE